MTSVMSRPGAMTRMTRFVALRLLLIVLFTMSGQTQNVTTIKVNQAETRQTIDGFGASGAWWSQIIGGWSDENLQRIIDLLFNASTGIGLTIYRYNIGGGEQGLIDPWRNTETFEIRAGEYDWSRDANALRTLRAARDAGVTDVVVFANSPPGRMTQSGRAAGNSDGTSNLKPDMHGDFARYLVDITRHLIEEEGIPVRWISPINEPRWDWQPSKGQEGTHYTTNEMVSVLLALNMAIGESGLDVGISAVEAGEWSTAEVYAHKILQDPTLAAQLDHFAVHSYWSNPNDKKQFVSFMQRHYPETVLWMSEWTEMQQGRDYGMESALTLANTVHDDLTLGGVTTWQYWIAVSKYNFRDGLIYTREHEERIEETKRLWALGNYSRFVRPGAVRLDVEHDSETVRASAYLDARNRSLTLVVINNSPDPEQVSLEGIDPMFAALRVYETSDTHDLFLTYGGPASGSQVLSPRSVTTFIFQYEP